jgi:fructose-1-phosphate kinase PfkB-like protein
MELYNADGTMPLRTKVVLGVAAGATVLGGLFVEQLKDGNPCEASDNAIAWITSPICELPAAILNLSASDAPQTSRS